jgi:ATP-dependent DNA helicase RecG
MATPVQPKKDLSTPVQFVKGIGPKRATALADRGIRTVRDLLYYFPFDYIDLSNIETIGNLNDVADTGKWITVIGTVRTADFVGRPPRQRFMMVLGDETGTISLIFFRSVNFFKTAFKVGETLAVSGKVTSFRNRPQIIHPSIDRLSVGEDDENDLHGFLHTRGIVPKYGSSEDLKDVNLNVKGLRRIMKSAVDEFVDSVEEVLPSDIKQQHNFFSITQALRGVHFPESKEQLHEARRRLKFDELFSMQLLLAYRRNSVKAELPGISFNTQSSYARTLIKSLPFTLTKAQTMVLKEIADDMHAARPMNRLLQGDVGSGKTIVALIAMLIAVENGYQAAFMAPTEILAEQHFRTLSGFLKDLQINIRLLIGGQKAKLREDILEDIRRGSANIVVGTHAIIQEHVQFANLGFVVIDEQHRFGVAQRVQLREKGQEGENHRPYPDILVMTATPIPRTLSLTLYGDLDVSIINELPLHRKPIKTGLRTESQSMKVYDFLRQEVHDGRQAYIVYPLVEESEKLDLKAATESYEKLKSEIFPDLKVGLIHGRMPSQEKDEIMADFKGMKIDILVATTVIEVGIDVPNASVMVIEHAERFGLSQLHQLRGRVGRGAEQSYCILIAPDWMGKRIRSDTSMPMIDGVEVERWKAERRLKAMLETTDGFKIAEIDLELRGPGEFFGTKQSGLPSLQIANLMTDGDLLTLARREAFNIIATDPHLRLPTHQLLRKYFEERLRDAMSLVQVG